MKKVISLLLALSMVFALCACGNSTKAPIRKDYDVEVNDCALAYRSKGYVSIKPHVHNKTDMDARYLYLNCELIDKNGKTIRVAGCDTGGLVAGANEWVAGVIQISDEDLKDLAELKFSGGAFDISKNNICYRQSVSFAETTFTREYVFGE